MSICIIPARKGSTRIKNKSIRMLLKKFIMKLNPKIGIAISMINE